MKTAVFAHCGPSWMAAMTRPSQLSPLSIRSSLCCEFAAVGVTTLKFGNAPSVASAMIASAVTMFWR